MLNILFTELCLDKFRHSTKQAHMQGALWNQYTDPTEGENFIIYVAMKFIHETKQRQIWGQKSFKDDTKCIISHYCMSDMPPYKACNLCIDLLGNTHTLKVDRNLQWMSNHPTNPTYNPVLSGTMTHSSAQCLNSTTKTHNTNTYTQKVCIRYLMYCMPTFWKCDYSTCGPKCNRPPK